MRKLNLLRVPKEIEIIGMDISELGGVSSDMYARLKRDFDIATPNASPFASMAAKGRSPTRDGEENLNQMIQDQSKASLSY